jgi:hypothetical protein
MTNMNMKHLRKRFYIDAKVQGGLVMRVIMYWILCLLGVFLMLLCWRIITGGPQPFRFYLRDTWRDCASAVMATLLLLPLVITDIIRYSNRFVGPTMRLRRSLRQLARGQHVDPIEFRDSDFWQEFADEFNAVAAHLQGNRIIDLDQLSKWPDDSRDECPAEREDEPVAVG